MDKCVHININRNMHNYDKLLALFVTNLCRVQKNGVSRKAIYIGPPFPVVLSLSNFIAYGPYSVRL